VTGAQLDTLTISPQNASLAPNRELGFTASGKFSDGSSQDLTLLAKWMASDVSGTDVASISSRGIATGKNVGVSLISATVLGKSASTKLFVRSGPAPALVSIEVAPLSAKLGRGMTQRFTAMGTYNDSSMLDVSSQVAWMATDVSGTGVATIAADGLATARAVGTATITASLMGKSGVATLIVSQPATWSTMASGTTQVLTGVWGSGRDDVWVVGDAGTILHYDGTNLSSVPSGTMNQLLGVWSSGKNDVWVAGVDGTVLRYGGTRFSKMATGSTQILQGVWGTSANNVWLTGEGGTILRWDGTSLTQHAAGLTTAFLLSVWGSAPNDVWAVGEMGTIVHYNGTSWRTTASGSTSGVGDGQERCLGRGHGRRDPALRRHIVERADEPHDRVDSRRLGQRNE
jgi:hypothetical protein